MARILILFAHPALERSRVQRRLVEQVPDRPGITFHDLYEAYPDFDVDVGREQGLLLAHDLVVFQHPFYWYSTPPMLKQWEDLVLEHGWAYGSRGVALAGKRLLNVVSLGGGAAAYSREGYNRFTVRELLAPVEQTARLCKMEYLAPYAIFGTHRMADDDVARAAARYRGLLDALHGDRVDYAAARAAPLLNDVLDDAIGDPTGAAGDAVAARVAAQATDR